MSEFLRSYLTVAIFTAVSFGLVAGLLALGGLLRPVRPLPQKYIPYESGVDPVGAAVRQIRYVFALLFVLFDVEAVFIFPWATQPRARRLRPHRDGRVRRRAAARPDLRLEEGRPPVGVTLATPGLRAV
jgi:NADH-quinone oxidoreductase subunit A